MKNFIRSASISRARVSGLVWVGSISWVRFGGERRPERNSTDEFYSLRLRGFCLPGPSIKRPYSLQQKSARNNNNNNNKHSGRKFSSRVAWPKPGGAASPRLSRPVARCAPAVALVRALAHCSRIIGSLRAAPRGESSTWPAERRRLSAIGGARGEGGGSAG